MATNQQCPRLSIHLRHNLCKPSVTKCTIYSLVVILILLLDYVGAASMPTYLLKGNKLSCSEEGQVVVIPFLKQDPCITCMCFNSEIDCFKNTCPDSLNCYHYQSNQTEPCCRKCRTCNVGDQVLLNGDSMQDPEDVCKSYHCNSGTVTEYRTQCYVPCDNPVSLLGQCCPSCNACPKRNAPDGQTLSISTDPCIKCHCFKGQMICTRKVCPVLPCLPSNWVQSQNSCCPVCRGSKDADHLRLSPMSCLMEDRVYEHNSEFRYDQCTTCVCKNATNVCHRQTCPPLPCAASEQVRESGQCCSKCMPTTRAKKTKPIECTYKNRHYKSGERWTDSCHDCMCNSGKVSCLVKDCPKDFVCPAGHKKIRTNGDCCESCVREDGKCVVRDQLQNITTYDGLNYRWTGKCNYVLTRDCDSKQFSLHLVHKFRNSSTKPSVPIYEGASLAIKFVGSRIFLSHLGRVRVNRTLVNLPFVQIGQFSITQSNQLIKFRSVSGLEVSWQTNQSIEIKLKSHFQDKMCGLCGNYNLDQLDEFQTKNTKQVTTLDKFANSFKVGKNLLCPKNPPKPVQRSMENDFCGLSNWADRVSATRICNRMKQRYPRCPGYMSAESAYQQCLDNVCSCRGDKQCQCFALERYINSCNSKSEEDKFLKTSMCRSFTCPPGSEFKFCSFNCRKTCKKRAQNNQCVRKSCKSGCECIGNRVWHKGQCIPEVMCPL